MGKPFVRRYYYAYTLAGAINTLGIPERTYPGTISVHTGSDESIAAIVIFVARMNVQNPEDAERAKQWVRRIAEYMNILGHWSRQQCDELLAQDCAHDFHLPVV